MEVTNSDMKSNEYMFTSLMVLATAVLAGCGSTGGLLERAGIASPSDVRMVVFQRAGYGHLPMNLTFPMRGQPAATSDAAQVKAFYEAINNPDGKAWTRDSRNNRLAFVTQDGQVIMFGFGGGRPVKDQGPDITAEHSSSKLMTAMLRLAHGKRQSVTIPGAQVLRIRLNIGRQITAGSTQFANAEALWRDLISCYSPLNLKGNLRCSMEEVRRHVRQAPQYLEVTLPKPAEFKAIVGPTSSTWPPSRYDTKSMFEDISYDHVYVLDVPVLSPSMNRLVRFAFVDNKTGDCLITDPVDPRKLTKKARGRQPAVYGPDLFAELVSMIQR